VTDCLFCKMASGEIQPDIVYEDDEILAFNDINPQAPTHVLVIPKRHIPTVNDMEAGDAELVGRLFLVAKKIAADRGFADEGYRSLVNCNAGAGQTVFHVHLHVLGGRPLGWPPG